MADNSLEPDIEYSLLSGEEKSGNFNEFITGCYKSADF